jgi:hypothetical protein
VQDVVLDFEPAWVPEEAHCNYVDLCLLLRAIAKCCPALRSLALQNLSRSEPPGTYWRVPC